MTSKASADTSNCPSLNTQSCVKVLLVVQDFCFWAVWAAEPVKSRGPILCVTSSKKSLHVSYKITSLIIFTLSETKNE